MKKVLMSTFAAFGLAACVPSDTPASAPAADASGLEAALAGRTAEAPVSCVNLQQLSGNKGFADGSILFQGQTSASTVYVNRPPGGCPSLSSFRALRTRTTTGQLCSGDIVTVFDPTSGIDYGSCGLGEFTPYRKP
jgi:hypothetical protein